MSEQNVKTYVDFILPPSIVSRADVSRLVSEVEQVDNELVATAVRAKNIPGNYVQPVLSGQLTEFLQHNSLVLNDSHERSLLIKQLRLLKNRLPVVHMTFATATDTESLGQLTQWMRTSVHPQAVIAVGLQPALVAGVYVRTPNHVYDLSLRTKFKNSRGALVKELEKLRGQH